ncbi:murein biosynthesis integral membrane protein MurJ [Paraburkholderia caballeronis]|uniref:murein biosynthesis integral membrane protein MurJ n=1 Tax=Paraburkholderia caballeronis TaxID=416943 RepID=UPI001065978A|nr:murein biosynthesis integral membrane protein MurJ [Paraburkholderia caballeronis]TDV08295.1 putative peptidoglycan lipid II flippase [Paraburkholderia caballeronis]TDV11987.1 putative peptidoglycan lipid II flippase [Paraburkholderia caballeronis]TDV22608.1 putative peptidoglycan lipid II flippase [Paraburkholderia caballeronis]TDV35227.1 putative peptidoglycan lipid II flippase [Paraburkholderia caballeronis]
MNLFRALLTVSGFTLLSRVTGLARETLIARAFGASQYTDAFYVAFRIPNLLRRISAEGAFSQAFVPILAEFKSQKGHDATRALVDATSTVLAWALAILSLLGIAGASVVVFAVASGLKSNGDAFPLAVTMTRIMFPYVVFISLTSLASGVLNTYKQFSLPAFAPVLLNVSFIVAALFAAPHMRQPVYALAWAVIVGGVLQFLVQLPGLKRIDMMPHIALNPVRALAHRGVKRVLGKMVPAMFAVSVAQISLIINTNIASHLGPGAVSWINYADRLMEFPTALLGVALGTILLPSLSKAHVDADPHEYSALLDWGLRVTFLLAAPSAVALFFFAQPLTATLFHYGKFDAESVVMVGRALAAYGVGLIGLILIKILAPGFYARQDIKTPVKIGIGVLAATQASNYVFVPLFAHAGLTLSVGLGACINALLLYIGLRRRGIYTPSAGWPVFVVQMLGACLVLAGAMHWCSINYDWIGLRQTPFARIVLLGACLVLFAALYFGMLWLMGFKYAYFKRRTK